MTISKTIIIITATYTEMSSLIEVFQAQRHPDAFPWDIFTARNYSTEIILVVSGIGASNASAASALMAHLFTPDLIIVTGCAGAYSGSGLKIGDLALATSEIFADEGIESPEGWRSLEHIGIPLLERNGTRYFNEIPLSPRVNAAALDTADRLGISLTTGRFLTVATCSGTEIRGEELKTRFRGICENMEGAAVALVAARHGIECLEIRGISNYVENRDITRWEMGRAVANSQRFIERFIRREFS